MLRQQAVPNGNRVPMLLSTRATDVSAKIYAWQRVKRLRYMLSSERISHAAAIGTCPADYHPSLIFMKFTERDFTRTRTRAPRLPLPEAEQRALMETIGSTSKQIQRK